MFKNKWLLFLILASGSATAGQGWHCGLTLDFQEPDITIRDTSITMNGNTIETGFYTDGGSYRLWGWGHNPAHPKTVRYQFRIESRGYPMNVPIEGILYDFNVPNNGQKAQGYACKRFE